MKLNIYALAVAVLMLAGYGTASAQQQEKQPESDPVLAALEGIVHLDDLSQKTGLDTAALLARLTLLELKGKVRQLPGQFYEKA